MGWLSAVCLWTTAHLPSPICLQKTITQKQSLPHRSLSVCLYLSALFISPLKKSMYFFFVCARWVWCNSRREERGHFISTVDSFWKRIHYDDSDFQIYHPETYVRREREKKGGKQAEGKIEPNPTISSQSCTLLINGWLVYQTLTDDCCF